MMYLYLVERTDQIYYEQYDSFVCVAENAGQALGMLPDPDLSTDYWTNDQANLKCTWLGEAAPEYRKPAIILTSASSRRN